VPIALCHQRLPSLAQTIYVHDLFNVHTSAPADPSGMHASTVPVTCAYTCSAYLREVRTAEAVFF